jgi:hypothetical protein
VLFAPLCKAAAALVRELDAEDAAVDADVAHIAALTAHLQPPALGFASTASAWRWQPHPHSPARVQLRLQRVAHQRGWPPVLRAELYNLATRLLGLRDAGVVRFVLDRRAGRLPCLFGYHELTVHDPAAFFIHLHKWATQTIQDKNKWLNHHSVVDFTRVVACTRPRNITVFLKNLLALAGLHPVHDDGERDVLNPLAYRAWRLEAPARRSARLASSAAAATAASATRI